MTKKAQVAAEASSIFTFMTLVFIIVLLFTGNALADLSNQRREQLFYDIGEVISSEFALAAQSQSGYHREFALPATLKGMDYNVSILTSQMMKSNFSNLVINGTGRDYVFLLPKDISGKICSPGLVVLDKVNSTTVAKCIP